MLRHKSQWFIGKHWQEAGKDYYLAHFGDFKANLEEAWHSWESNGEKVTKEEIAAAKMRAASMLDERQKEKLTYQTEIAPILEKEFYEFAEAGDVPYLRRKGISGNLWGGRIKDNAPHSNVVCVPLIDVSGKFWNYQRIYSEKLSAGDKFFAEGARIEGCFHILRGLQESRQVEARAKDSSNVRGDEQNLRSDNGVAKSDGGAQTNSADQPGQQNTSGHPLINIAHPIYVCEGFATAASIKLALGAEAQVVAAFNAANLLPVATAIKEVYPAANIIICGDNDAYTVIRGRSVNIGVEKGRRAAGAVRGNFVYPVFKYPAPSLTDYNDLHNAEGLEKVKDQILNFSNYVKGIQPMVLFVSKSGKTTTPTEKDVSDYILKEMQGRLCRQDKSLFVYKGTHWEELDAGGIFRMQQMIQVAANGLLGIRDLEAYYKYLLMACAQAPRGRDMWQPNPFAANFQDGTLHLTKGTRGDFTLEFKKHAPEDYLTSVLPFSYPKPEEGLPPAPQFDSLIDRLWSDHVEKDTCKRFALQAIGAALMPAFPLVAFFHGKPNSGKSTFIKLMIKLLGYENISSVQPCEWHGFNLESMVGKLVNYDLDIDVNKPINDSEMKKVIDRVPRRVRRKNRLDAYAYLPAVHLFASNKLPRSMDGSSHAYGRRLIMLRTEGWQAGTDRILEFEENLLEQERAGIVARGLAGLADLAGAQGFFAAPEESKTSVQEIEMESDVVGQFLEDCAAGEVRDNNTIMNLDPLAQISRSNLWEVFNNWQRNSLHHSEVIGKYKFFQSIKTRNFSIIKSSGIMTYRGLGTLVKSTAVC